MYKRGEKTVGENRNPSFNSLQRRELIERVFQTHFDQLCWYSCQIVKDMEAAKDITADAFTNLLGYQADLKEESETGVIRFLTASIRNRSLNWKRDQKSHKCFSLESETADKTSLSEMLIDPEDSIEDCFIRQEQCEKLHEAITQLSPKQRKCVQQRYIKGLSHKETAGQMDITCEASRALASRAVRKLRSIMGQDPNYQ